LEILGEKLDLDLIDGNIEESVGNFYCDITAFDSDKKNMIIIENQLGTTNHDHLGKILTYAAGKDASIVIWIAENFREEHQKALEWINERSDPEYGVSFFGIELKLINIKDSPPAVDLEIVVKPNDWERTIKIADKGTSETNKKYLVFFNQLVESFSKTQKGFRKPKPQPWSFLNFGAGKTGLYYSWAFRMHKRFSVELYIDTGDKERNERYFDELKSSSNEISGTLRNFGEVSWEKLEDKRACRIAIYRDIKDYMNSLDESDFKEIIGWATEAMKAFSGTLSEYITKLK
jgi:hypothetical protein